MASLMQHDAESQTLDRRLFVWTLLACAGLWIAMAVPMFRGRVYVADDLGAYHLPLRSFYAEQLGRGRSFDWIPSLYSGFYLTGEGQIGGYHPLHLVLYRWLPLGTAFDLELLLSYPLMLAGTYVLLMRRLGQRSAALFGGLVFTFSGFNLLHFVHPNAVAVVAHIPWLLWAIDVLLTSPGVRQRGWAAAAIALLTGSQLLLGYPQYVWFSLVAEACYVLSRRGAIAGSRWQAVLLWSVALGLGLLVGGIQLLPTIEALGDSKRATADAAFNYSGSLSALNAVQLIAPYLFATRVVGQNTHELGLYVGTAPLLLCAWLLQNRWARQSYRPLVLSALALGAVGYVMALGEHGFISQLQRFLPLVGAFRFPCRAIVLVHLALAVLAAVGLLLVERGPSPEDGSASRLGSAWLLVGLSILAAAIGPLVWPEFIGVRWLVWIGPAAFALAALLLWAATRGSRMAVAALVLMTAIDLGGYGLSYAVWPLTEPLDEFAAAPNQPPDRHGSIVAESEAARSQGLHVGNRLLLAGFRRADGYVGLEPIQKLDYSQSDALRIAGVHWRAADLGWSAVADPLAKVRLATTAILDETGPLPPAAFRTDAALVDEPLDLPPGDPGQIELLTDEPGWFEIATNTPDRQLLVVAESFHPGWQAVVDGQSVPVLRVNRDFLGCVVAAGQHRVELRFRPVSLRLGAMLSSLGLGLIVGLLGLTQWAGRKSQIKTNP
jgi:hypothetical protein